MRPRVPASHGLPLPRPLLAGLTGRLVGLRAELGPRHQMRVRREPGHVDADLSDQLGGGHGVDAGNVSKPGRLGGERADLLLDAGVERGDLGADPIAVVEHHAQDRRVVVGEEPAQRLFEPRGLLARLALGQPRQCSRIALSGDQGVHHRSPGQPCSSDSTDEILIWASSSSFSMRCCSRVRSCTRARR